jgi:hypothetical protein
MNKETDIFEKISHLLTENPTYFGVFVLLIGVSIILASLFNWDWIFTGHSHNTQKIEGSANVWGRGFARLKFGVIGFLCIVTGIMCIVLS